MSLIQYSGGYSGERDYWDPSCDWQEKMIVGENEWQEKIIAEGVSEFIPSKKPSKKQFRPGDYEWLDSHEEKETYDDKVRDGVQEPPFQFPNHNELIYKFITNMLKDKRSISITYNTFESGKDIKEEYILGLEISTNKRSIKAKY